MVVRHGEVQGDPAFWVQDIARPFFRYNGTNGDGWAWRPEPGAAEVQCKCPGDVPVSLGPDGRHWCDGCRLPLACAPEAGAVPRRRHDGDSGPIDFHELPPERSGLPPVGDPDRIPQVGDMIQVCDSPGGPWRPVKVRGEDSPQSDGSILLYREGWIGHGYGTGEGTGWRWPVEVVLRPVPEVRRCAVQVGILGNGVAEECGAVLGRELTPERCRVCLGRRCYSHCGGHGHSEGATLLAGAGSRGWEWQMFAVDGGRRFVGQVWRTGRGELLKFGPGVSSDAVMNECLAAFSTHSMPEPELYGPPPLDPIRELRELPQDAVRLPPLRGQGHALGALAALKGHVNVRLNDVHHGARRRSDAVIDAVLEWLEQTAAGWDELAGAEDMSPRMVERCRQLHTAQLTDLFARIGGVL